MSYIKTMNNSDGAFYRIMGPFLSKRTVVKELGSNIWDDDNKTWFINRNETCVFGFASIFIYKNRAHLQSVYTIPEYRNLKVATSILTEIVRFCKKNNIDKIKSTVTQMGLPLHRKFGFKEMSKKGRYTKMEKELQHCSR